MKFSKFINQTLRTLPALEEKYETFDGEYGEYFPLCSERFTYNLGGDKGRKDATGILDHLHMRIGMVGEYSELISAIAKKDDNNILEELVDQLWYIANDINLKKDRKELSDSLYTYLSLFEFRRERLEVSGIYKYPELSPGIPLSGIILNIYITSILIDLVKKQFAYGKLECDNIVEEVYAGLMYDLLVSINNIVYDHNVSSSTELDLEVGMDRVIAKLKQRYPDKFDADLAQNRDLQKEKAIIDGSQEGEKDNAPEVKENTKEEGQV